MTAADWMRLAIKQAELAEREGEVPVGAVIIKNGELIARAHNLCEANSDPTAHAELLAVKQAANKLGKSLEGCTLYCTVAPCKMCQGAIENARISRVVYGAPGAVPPGTPDIVGGVLGDECKRIIKRAFINARQEEPWQRKQERP